MPGYFVDLIGHLRNLQFKSELAARMFGCGGIQPMVLVECFNNMPDTGIISFVNPCPKVFKHKACF